MVETKKEIMRIALRLFAAHGYAAVSVRQIAQALGLSKGALYRHFQSKRDIFDCIVSDMAHRDSLQALQYEMPVQTYDQDPASYERISKAQLVAFSKAQFVYWTEDEMAALFRRLLKLEQYRDPHMAKLYDQYLVSGPLSYVEEIMRHWSIQDPQAEAMAFYGPMFMAYSLADHAAVPKQVKAQLFAYLDDYIGGE